MPVAAGDADRAGGCERDSADRRGTLGILPAARVATGRSATVLSVPGRIAHLRAGYSKGVLFPVARTTLGRAQAAGGNLGGRGGEPSGRSFAGAFVERGAR